VPARNIDHDAVRNALIKDGWTITDDPYRLSWGGRNLYVDLAAERMLTAERGNERIVVEIQSFVGPSSVSDLQDALGQFILYRAVMDQNDPGRALYLAVSHGVYQIVFNDPMGRLARSIVHMPLIVFDPNSEEITQWLT
jgi:hypothetical protein